MSNKTALQELILKLRENTPPLDKEPDYYRYFRMANENAVKMAEYLLEKEKQQITEAYHNGQVIVFNLIKKAFPNYEFPLTQDEVDKIEYGLDVNEDAEDYFNSKYGNPQGDPGTTK